MSARGSSPKWPWLVGAAVALVYCGATLWPAAWQGFGIVPMSPPFADTVAILAAGEAHQLGQDIYRLNLLDPEGRPHVYGPWWLMTGWLGLRASDAVWLGALLGAAFVGLALRIARPTNVREGSVLILGLLSPPVLLGIERANNDLVVLLLLASAALLWARRGVAEGAAGVGVVATAALLKFYPAAALPALLGRAGSRREKIALLVGGAGLIAVLAWLWWDEIARALAVAPHPRTIFAQGVPLWPELGRGLSGAGHFALGGAAVGMGAGVIVLWPLRASLWAAWRDEARALSPFAASAGLAWLGCFVLLVNYPYRAVLLLPVLVAWGRAGGLRGPIALALVAAWLGAPKLWFALALADAAAGALPALAFTVGLEQALWAFVAVATAVSVLGWVWRGVSARA